jgi:prevent-host-death family protein
MGCVSWYELSNNTRDLLQRVGSGEEVTVTVDGMPVATLQPVTSETRWMSRPNFLRHISADATVVAGTDALGA